MRLNIVLTLPSVGTDLEPRRFHVTEAMNVPFRVTVEARIRDHNVALGAIVGGRGSLELAFKRRKRRWHGVVTHIEQVEPEATGLSSYEVTLSHDLWLLTQVKTQRVFQHLSLPDIVGKVLEPYRIEPIRRLTGDYAKHEYVVQYRETDFDFVHRLLEDAGISYFFEHGPADSRLVLSDAPEANPPRGGEPLHYVPRPHPESKDDYVTAVQLGQRVAPGKVRLRDYSFRRPDFELAAEAEEGDRFEKTYEQYFYEPGAFLIEVGGPGGEVQDDQGKARHEVAEGKRRAQRRLESLRADRRAVDLETNAIDLAPGSVFSMDNHPHPWLASSAKLLVTEMTLGGSQTGDWVFHGRALFADQPYQGVHKTRRPRIQGVQSAIVVGPKGEEIYTDEYGRVRVQFHWDREGKGVSEGQPSSTWMRVSQAWAGKAWGSIDIPRVGQEVLVGYFDGDPSQPVVLGRVHNKLQPVPYKLPKHKAKSVWKSDTSPHKDNAYNEVRMDDRKDFELFFLQAQRDRQELVRRLETERAGENHATVVGNCRSAIVGQVDAAMIGTEYSVQMIEPPTVTDLKILSPEENGIPPQKKPIVEPLPTKLDMVEAKIMATTEKATLEMDGPELVFEAKGEISFKAKGNIVIEGGSDIKINC